jgi:hypothetical protein
MSKARRQWWKPTAEREYGLALVWNSDYKGGLVFGIRTLHGQGEVISLNRADVEQLHTMLTHFLADVRPSKCPDDEHDREHDARVRDAKEGFDE